MATKLGINGFGRIGRIIFRTCLLHNELEVTAINDPAIDAEYICYLIKFDSTHGKFSGTVTRNDDNEIIVDDRPIKIFREKLPSSIPWQSAGVQYVIESSGMFTSLEKASGHLRSVRVKRVIVTAPSVDVPMLILGVNDGEICSDMKVLSCASSTLYCLAPVIKILEDNYGVSEGFVTSIHAMTPSLKPLDGLCLRGKHWRDHRSIHQNIIPAATGACKALGKIMPQVKDKLTGLAFRVPIVNVSVLDISIRLCKETTWQDILKKIEEAGRSKMENIIKVTRDDNVSSDFAGDEHSCIVDGNSSLQLKPDFYKIVCWYENEYSYACRVIDTVLFIENQLKFVLVSEFRDQVKSKNSSVDKIHNIKAAVESYGDAPQNSKVFRNNNESKQNTYNADAMKPLRRPDLYTTSDNDCKAKYSKDTFKISKENDLTSKTGVRNYSGSFFHSCISFANPTNTIKAQERLEKVKREFSKMVNITEDLLKKSCSYKLNLLPDPIPENSLTTERKKSNTIVKVSNTDTKHLDEKTKTDSASSDIPQDNGRMHANSYEKDESSSSSIEIGNIDFETEKIILLRDCREDMNINNTNKSGIRTVKQEDNCRTNLINDNFINEENTKEDFDLKLNPETEKLTDEILLRPNSSNKEEQINLKLKDNETSIEINNSSIDMSGVTKTDILKEENYQSISDKLTLDIHKNQTNLINSLQFGDSETNRDNAIVSSKNLMNCLNKLTPEPVIVIANKKSTCSEITIATSAYGEFNKNKIDLFEKLDSECGTGSECSFEIRGRASQVIHITDLTNSLEDLSRLDKICKIIEISDELSDKLFSALDSGDVETLKRKKWSFKDLCDKIQLDEFCTNVFGKSIM
ncbi:uncharacterized protein LOC114251421 [Bombyx mandarina]|uniref:glyceraldehyde-3-phosphate dehydrogenase (phosphorylating) n=1 Tax=Bombyx mandarina TaxID=7092 RepID=A0A6J2KGK1_BOMMA|nr:uncharacterized protein LOC114251421 [Bombyx mandarina]